MLLIREELSRGIRPGAHALTLGVFDGVHRGHQLLFNLLRTEAASRQLSTGIITFHPHPITVLRPDIEISYLTSLETRVEQLRATGVDSVVVVQFTSELAQVSAEDFASILVEETGLKLLVTGHDFTLGRNREGSSDQLKRIGTNLGFEVYPIELLPKDGEPVSSTRVRNALTSGEMDVATELLGRPFVLRGPIVHGDERGRTIGFPTINLGLSPDLMLPADGVYVSYTEVAGIRLMGCTNIGVRPTFDGVKRVVETHLLDFEGDLYGQVASIELLDMLRPEQKFEGPEILIAQIGRDVAATRTYFQ